MKTIEVEFHMYWFCPFCGESVSDTDEGVEDEGDTFEVTCLADVDDGTSEEFKKCGHKYTVRK